MRIDDATPADAPAIAEIFNAAVTQGTELWDIRERDTEDRARWIAERQADGFPVLVSRDATGTVTGYASYGPFGHNVGYRHTVENSVYIHAEHRGQGLGRALMTALIEHARAAGLHAMVAAIDAKNVTSVRLHKTFGFSVSGTLPQVGVKFGAWRDLTYMTLILNDTPPPDDVEALTSAR